MQPVTIVESKPSERTGYSENYSARAAIFVSVMLLLCAIGVVVCGAMIYVPLGAYFSPVAFQIIAFVHCGLYLLTAIIGFGTICKTTCMIVFFMIACILTTLSSLGSLVYYCYLAPISTDDFDDCQLRCTNSQYITIPIYALAILSAMAFITALTGSIFCCCGMRSFSSSSGGRQSSTVLWDPNTTNKY